MSIHPPSPLPPSDPRSLWERAAELDRQRASAGEGGLRSPANARELSVAELLEVGREVGISPDSVLLSVAEGRLPDGNELRPRRESPLWHRLLVEIRDALEVPLHLAVPPGVALQLLDEVMERQEYRMTLEDRIGTDADEAWVSVFRNAGGDGLFQGSDFHGTLHLTDGRVLVVAVLPDADGGSRVRIRMPLYERGVNLTFSGASGGLAGAGVLAFRKLQRWGFGKGRTALARLGRALEMEAEAWLREAMREEGDAPALPPASERGETRSR